MVRGNPWRVLKFPRYVVPLLCRSAIECLVNWALWRVRDGQENVRQQCPRHASFLRWTDYNCRLQRVWYIKANTIALFPQMDRDFARNM